jgi:hypothetical protein
MSKHAERKGRISSRKIRRLVWVSAIVAVFALGATAAVSLRAIGSQNPARQPGSAQANDTRSNLQSRAGGSIPLNAQTGQVRPLTQEEAERLAASIKRLVNQSTEGLQAVQHADGTVSMDLQGRFQSMAVAKRTEDGELVESCVDNPEAAAVFFEIDPALVGVKKSATAPKTKSAAQPKSEVR